MKTENKHSFIMLCTFLLLL